LVFGSAAGLMLRLVEQVGLHEPALRFIETLAGNAGVEEKLKFTGCAAPLTKVEVTETEPVTPCFTLILPLFESV